MNGDETTRTIKYTEETCGDCDGKLLSDDDGEWATCQECGEEYLIQN